MPVLKNNSEPKWFKKSHGQYLMKCWKDGTLPVTQDDGEILAWKAELCEPTSTEHEDNVFATDARQFSDDKFAEKWKLTLKDYSSSSDGTPKEESEAPDDGPPGDIIAKLDSVAIGTEANGRKVESECVVFLYKSNEPGEFGEERIWVHVQFPSGYHPSDEEANQWYFLQGDELTLRLSNRSFNNPEEILQSDIFNGAYKQGDDDGRKHVAVTALEEAVDSLLTIRGGLKAYEMDVVIKLPQECDEILPVSNGRVEEPGPNVS